MRTVMFALLLAGWAGDVVAAEQNNSDRPVRAGYSFRNWENHSLRFSLEVTPARYEDLTVVGTGLNFGWQWF